MASNFILEINGVKGECKVDKHKDHIDIDSWSTGISQSGSYAVGGGGGTGKAVFQDVHFSKQVESSSNDLQLKCAGHDPIDKAILHVYKQGKNNEKKEYVKITLEKGVISSYQVSAGGDGAPQEQFSINFAKYKFEYAPQKDDGTMESFKSMSWDVKEGKKV
jgi:type VI secretion system secreted protein Hcp